MVAIDKAENKGKNSRKSPLNLLGTKTVNDRPIKEADLKKL